MGDASGSRAQLLSEQGHDVVGIRIAAEHRLGEDEFVVYVDVEDSVRARHDLDGADSVLPFLEDPRRQTGCVRQRASGNAVLDPDVMPLPHRAHSLNPMPRAPGFTECVSGSRSVSASPSYKQAPCDPTRSISIRSMTA
jgi:hypothetical protein